MNNKVKKIITILATVLCIVMVSTVCLAVGETKSDKKSVTEIRPSDINGKSSDVELEKVQSIGNSIATIIRNVGIVAAVIILMILGVKYMIGSAEEKAEYKKTFMPLIIGIVLVVSATTIASFIFSNAE